MYFHCYVCFLIFQLEKYVSTSKLKYYFAVDTKYVGKKLGLLMFPYAHTVSTFLGLIQFLQCSSNGDISHSCTTRLIISFSFAHIMLFRAVHRDCKMQLTVGLRNFDEALLVEIAQFGLTIFVLNHLL